MSAVIRVRNADGEFVNARALLDTCATANFVTETLARQLRLPMRACLIPIGAINEMRTMSKNSIEIHFRSVNSNFQKTLTFLTVPKIADLTPDEAFPRDLIKIPANLRLADSRFHVPRPVDVLIGSGATLSLLSIGQINLSRNNCDLILQKTQLGWVIAGNLAGPEKGSAVSYTVTDLTNQIAKFWEIKDTSAKAAKTSEEILCEDYYVENKTRERSGRYIVRLPFRTNDRDFGDSRDMALKRFHSIQKRLNANPSLKMEYHKVMQEYIELGHMTPVDDESTDGYYMPHHPVTKASSSTTKVRVVFDASAKGKRGISLNDVLMVGPTIQDKLFEHLLRFRTHVYVLTADIAKMYRQILIHPDERRYQRVFWLLANQIKVFELNTVTFGVSSAPYLAIRTIQQLASDESADFPLASQILKRDLYVDDLLTGAESISDILKIRDEVIELLKRGGFDMRRWASNHHHAFDDIDEKILELDCAIEENPILKTLGVVWNSRSDEFVYTVNSIDSHNKVTKRDILSKIAKVFDPLGLLGPIVLTAKAIMQDCWRAKIDWDESVPQKLHSKWITFAEQIELIRNLAIKRRLLLDNPTYVELHGFCNASKIGYGACIYVRSSDSHNNVLVRLSCAKSRVAPLKETTIPRLELCAAQILARLYTESRSAFIFPIDRIIFWSDSTIVLQWIKKSPQVLKIFEANRVAEIQALEGSVEWRHIRTDSNPADALSRGQLPAEFLRNNTWFEGPTWLRRAENTWPVGAEVAIAKLPGLRKKYVSSV